MQITKAMELVASSKLRKAKERAEVCRPYFETMHQTLVDLSLIHIFTRNGNADTRRFFAYQRILQLERVSKIIPAICTPHFAVYFALFQST